MNRLLALLCLLPVPLFGAAGDVLWAHVETNGWVLQVKVEGMGTNEAFSMGLATNNSPLGAEKVRLSFTQPGFTSAGASNNVSVSRVAVKPMRLPYPQPLTNDATEAGSDVILRLVLSDYVYAGDGEITGTIAAGLYGSSAAWSGTVTNNSVITHPKVIGHFVVEQRRPVNGETLVEVAAIHKYADGGRPVERVEVRATGVTSGASVTNAATAMTKSARDGLPVYAVPLTISTANGFTRGEIVRVNFTAYPRIGNAGSVLDSEADVQTINKFGPLFWTVMDKMIAVVDPGAGNDDIGMASTIQSTADSAPFATINRALTAIAGTNNAAYSLNRVDGGEVQLKAGTSYKVGAYGSQASVCGYWTLCPHSSTDRAGVVVDGWSGNQYQYANQRYLDITISRPSAAYLVFAGGTNVMVCERVAFLDGFGQWYDGDTTTDLEFLNCVTTNTQFAVTGGNKRIRLNRDFTATNLLWTTSQNVFYGTRCVYGGYVSGASCGAIWAIPFGETVSVNTMIGYTKIENFIGDSFAGAVGLPLTNLAIFNNVVERNGASASPLMEYSEGFQANLLFANNTFTGQRFNHENDVINAPFVDGLCVDFILRNNVLDARGNHRAASSVAYQANIQGWWAIDNSVGCHGNYTEGWSFVGDQDFWGLFSNGYWPGFGGGYQTHVGYIANASRSGTDAGSGDYHLSSTNLTVRWDAPVMLPWDIDGNARGISDPPGAYASGNVRKGGGFF